MRVLNDLRPGCVWSPLGPGYDDIEWLDDARDKPSLAECEEAWRRLEPIILLDEAISARRAAFQSMSDPVFFKWQRGEATKQDWLDAVASVREQFPYPK